jgi:DNA/RNA endonuclease G (NUC1)
MRNIILVLLFLFTFEVNAQSDSVYVVETPIYLVHYSVAKQQPVRLEYRIDCPAGDVERSGNFWTDARFITSDGYDYRDNVWDKGHLAPAATFSCTEEELKLTFSYLNCVLQHESLNRGVWSLLERFERSLAYFYDVHVIVTVEFDDSCEILETGATVPKGFYKTIYWADREQTFYFPNQRIVNANWHDFMINNK